MNAPATPSLRIGSRFELQPARRRMLVDGAEASLGARAFDLLCALTQRPGELVTKRDLMDLVWPDVVVEENNVQQQVSALRKLLGADVIATIPGRGYRFIAPVEQPAATDPRPVPRPGPPDLLKTNLPSVLSPLIGRDDDRRAVVALIDGHRLVTIAGAGGIGKSRLAEAVLFERRAAYRHGVCLVELAATTAADLLPGAIGNALGISVVGGSDALPSLVETLSPLSLLLALDNAEHLADAVARIAEALNQQASGLHLLITSQVPLKLRDEHVYRLGPLALPEATPSATEADRYGAVALFSARAHAVDRGFAVTEDNVAAVVELCRRLDGVALAIELAAARVPLLGLTGLVASLDERLRLLTGGGPTAPLRQRTLRAALQWSHGLLDEVEQTVFRRLAVFAGSMALDSALRVAADGDASAAIAGRPGVDEWDSLDALAALVDRSLVAVVGQGDEAPRYRLLDTVHAFALERLQAAGDEDARRQRHLEAMRSLFEPALAERYGGRVAVDEWQRRLEPDCANGLAAVSWAIAHDDPLGALAIAPALFHPMAAAAMRRQAAALWLAVNRCSTSLTCRPLRRRWWVERPAPVRVSGPIPSRSVRWRGRARRCGH